MTYQKRMDDLLCGLRKRDSVKILAIETSCDETAAAVVENGRSVLGSMLYSQIAIHREFGGVVPEIASRNHTDKLPYITDGALREAGLDKNEIDAVAVTAGPGLVGALLTGVAYAKAFAYGLGKPLIAVNHMEGHIAANYITHKELEPPFICLIVSGGHTTIVHVRGYGEYETLGETRDDAAGEAFDKIARVLGMPYPGGPNLERLAAAGDENAYLFPKSFKGETHLDFSFSGVKTAVINLLHHMEQKKEQYNRADVAASFQKAVTSVLVDNTVEAARRTGSEKIVLAGGVSANGYLRKAMAKAAGDQFRLYLPDVSLSTDNGAMIGAAAYYTMKNGSAAGLELNADPAFEVF